MEAIAQALEARRPRRTLRPGTVPLAGLIVVLVILAALAGTVGLSGVAWAVGLSCAAAINAVLGYGLSRHGLERVGLADRVTQARATLAVGVAALVAESFERPAPVAALVSLATASLALDALDGWIARRTDTAAPFGAQFDGEVDAFLILVLSVYVSRSAGNWVLIIGAARYAFLVAGWRLRWMRRALPPRFWRKFVAATQGVVLTVAAAHVLPMTITRAALAGALVLLAESFGRDVLWLWNHRQGDSTPTPPEVVPAAGDRWPRRTLAAALTVFAILIVWAALLAPDRPQDVTPTAFLGVPIEGIALVALAVVLPTAPRRILAALAGPAIGLVVIMKILDIGFFDAFARPFDPVGDLGNLGIGVETLRSAIGGTQANLLIAGVMSLVVTVLVLTTLSLFRLMRVAAGNHRFSLFAIAALGAIWLLSSLFGLQLRSHTPIASASAAGFVVHEVRTVQADIRDSAVFAKQIRHDPLRNTSGGQLLTGLRGKDVLLVFVESYGRIAVQGASFSPTVDAVLARGTGQLRTAGFSARSAFLTSSTFGGLSWLSHSTLQSGVWVNSQRRYNQLVGTDRFTLSDAFRRAGWRTIDLAPADDRAWPEGSSFYHYDKLYDRRALGYRGPIYNYAPMPDQYMFLSLQRLELSKAHRGPLFAEVDTVSSHMPWNRIPQMVAWDQVGNGSIFNRYPGWVAKQGAFWPIRGRVRAAYARSLEYSLNTLISFVRHYGKKNLVLIVVGDEQPLAIVTGQGASHDVVISLIAHDPSVLKRIAGWGWQAGLRPTPRAPVWRMSAFRDRFLTAFGPNQVTR